MFEIGNMELLFIGIIAVLLFGNRLPSIMRSLGSGLHKLNRAIQDIQDDVNKQIKQ